LATSRADPAKYRELLAQADQSFGIVYRIGPAILLAAAMSLCLAGMASRTKGLAIIALVQVTVVAMVIVPIVGYWQQGRVVEAAAVVRGRSEPVVTWGANQPSFAVYRGVVTPVRQPQAGEIVLTRSDRLAEWPGAEVLYQSGGLALAKLPAEVHDR
jgi:hypothetical protein